MAGVAAPASGPDKNPERIARMFDAIAGKYDLLNHLLSVGLDRLWRQRAVRALDLGPEATVLDLCTGTGDLALAALAAPPLNPRHGINCGSHHLAHQKRVIGVDFSAEMLRYGRSKLLRLGERRVALVRGDAMRIPLTDGSVDAVTIGFGIRNVQKPDVAAGEILRVLKPGGRLAILEFGTPVIPGLRALYLLYFRRVLPLIGRLISRHNEAYAYLPASVAAFHAPVEFLTLLRNAGFSPVRVDRFTLGVVYLFVAQKEVS